MKSNCFKCNKELEPAMTGEDRMPYAGTIFISYGNYGSTVWDPVLLSNNYLEIVICDSCLLDNKSQVQHVRAINKPDYEFKPWDPEVEN